MSRFIIRGLMGAVLLAPLATLPATLRADDRVYHDRDRNDDHHWDSREDRAYRIWVRENHRRYREFQRLREEDRQSYWVWRHEHPNNVLRIDIR